MVTKTFFYKCNGMWQYKNINLAKGSIFFLSLERLPTLAIYVLLSILGKP